MSTKIWKFFPCQIGTRHAMQTIQCLLHIWPCFVHSRCVSPVTDLEPDHPIKSRCNRPASGKSPSEMELVVLLSLPRASKLLRYGQAFSPEWSSYTGGRVQLQSFPPHGWCACSSGHSQWLSPPHLFRTFSGFLNNLLCNKAMLQPQTSRALSRLCSESEDLCETLSYGQI